MKRITTTCTAFLLGVLLLMAGILVNVSITVRANDPLPINYYFTGEDSYDKTVFSGIYNDNNTVFSAEPMISVKNFWQSLL